MPVFPDTDYHRGLRKALARGAADKIGGNGAGPTGSMHFWRMTGPLDNGLQAVLQKYRKQFVGLQKKIGQYSDQICILGDEFATRLDGADQSVACQPARPMSERCLLACLLTTRYGGEMQKKTENRKMGVESRNEREKNAGKKVITSGPHVPLRVLMAPKLTLQKAHVS